MKKTLLGISWYIVTYDLSKANRLEKTLFKVNPLTDVQYEYDLLEEQLLGLKREDDAKRIRIFGGSEVRSALLLPSLGNDAEPLIEDWYATGASPGERPLPAKGFAQLVQLATTMKHVMGDAGVYNLLLGGRQEPVIGGRGAVFIDQNARYQDPMAMLSNLSILAQSLLLEYEELPLPLQMQTTPHEWMDSLEKHRLTAEIFAVKKFMHDGHKSGLLRYGDKGVLYNKKAGVHVILHEMAFDVIMADEPTGMTLKECAKKIQTTIGVQPTIEHEYDQVFAYRFNDTFTNFDRANLNSLLDDDEQLEFS